MTTPVGAASATPPALPGATAPKGEGLGQDAFMKLLVAQLKYQNPMAPADGQQYMTQMATFAQVEKLGQLVTAQADLAVWQKRLSAEGMVGRQVSGTSSSDEGAVPMTGVVTGVRFDKNGPVLELSGGRTLTVDQVEKVTTAPAPATPGTTASSAA
ncbi:MAG: flagellar hook capping protein [Frankiales bacterium]|nr:flagellar hook capping protein [Frankiales bacterium]